MLFSFAGRQAQAQSRQVTGQVTEANGGLLPGVSILIKGITKGAATDIMAGLP